MEKKQKKDYYGTGMKIYKKENGATAFKELSTDSVTTTTNNQSTTVYSPKKCN